MSPVLTVAILSIFSVIMLVAIYLIIRMEWHAAGHSPEPMERRKPDTPAPDDKSSVATRVG